MTDHYAVVGNPVAHSRSPQIHAEFARQTAQDMDYISLFAPLDGFEAAIVKFRDDGGKGVNVTLPFKMHAFRLATRHSERAQQAQAVNTLKFESGQTFGDNTDGAGLVRDIEINLGFALAGKRVLLMGAGGAARGVLLPVLERKPARLVIVNRTPGKALALVHHFARWENCAGAGYPDLAGMQFDIVINATSASVSGDVPPLPADIFAPNAFAYDMMYSQDHTPFMQFSRAHGAARVADGIGMLVEQAAESFLVWRGVRPQTAPVIEKFRSED
jgi:shikimate dehydrogenase